MSQRQFVVTFYGRKGRVVDVFKFGVGEEFTVEVVEKEPALPVRNPLSAMALNMDDLKVGMNIARYNKFWPGTCDRNVAIVNGQPFRDVNNTWMLPVVTTDRQGKLVREDWYLPDMGVVPYGESGKGRSFWNDQNYTLAV